MKVTFMALMFTHWNDAKAETPVLWPSHVKSWLIGKDWYWEGLGQEEKGTTEDEMAGWHRWLDGRESQWTPGVGDGQGGLACCDSWGCKESDTTEWPIWSDLMIFLKEIPQIYTSFRPQNLNCLSKNIIRIKKEGEGGKQ